MKYLWLLDAGHGGVIDGVPQTAGKRSPEWDKGVLYEGESNRRILSKVCEALDELGICYELITPEVRDISLRTRVNRVNGYAKHVKCIFLSFHSDGFREESANGWSAFTYFGQSDSDKVASIMYKHAKKAKLKLRTDHSDGDPDKEANFMVLRETICPAVLIENLFMTNKKDYNVLMSEKGQNKLAKIAIETIKEIESNGI